MGTCTRYDVAELGALERTPQGFLRAPAYLTRTGILEYRQPDGTLRRELRLPDEVFKPASLATLRAAPVTDLHPREMVTPKNVRKLAIGHVADNVRPDGAFVAGHVLVQDADTIAAVERGERRELSCGYQCEIDEKPGSYEGKPYDAVQRGIVYNHVGIGPKNWGRAGKQVALRIDGDSTEHGDAIVLDADDALATETTPAPAGDELVEVTADELEALRAEIDALRALVASQQLELDELEDPEARAAARDTQQATIDALLEALAAAKREVAKASDPERLALAINERADLLARARPHLSPSARTDGMTDREIHEAALRQCEPHFEPRSSHPDDYVRSRFDSALERLERRPKGTDLVRAAAVSMRAPIERYSARDILAGRVRLDVDDKPRKYEPPPWRQPLTCSTRRD